MRTVGKRTSRLVQFIIFHSLNVSVNTFFGNRPLCKFVKGIKKLPQFLGMFLGRKLRTKARGFGKVSYPIRGMAYTYASLILYLHHSNQGREMQPVLWGIIGLVVLLPHLFFVLYKASDCSKEFAIRNLDVDALLTGGVIALMHFSYVPTYTMFSLVLANMISVQGLEKGGLKALLLTALGMGAVGFLTGFEFVTEEVLSVNIVSLSLVLIYFLLYANAVNQYIIREKKRAKSTIEEKEVQIEVKDKNLSEKTKELELVVRKLTDSISYAKNIQQAMLPTKESFHDIFDDGFIFFQPRDELSGDFYWFEEVDGKKVIAAVDCTGHGVPGALMSMLGYDLLTDIVKVRKILRPDEILEEMDRGIKKILRQEETMNADGMDAAICVIDSEENKILYAGANNPLVLINEEGLTYLKGSRAPVGGFNDRGNHNYELHEMSVNSNGRLYLFSDGYQDQFGGRQGKKFMSKNFRKLLMDNYRKPMASQAKTIDYTMKKWMNDEPQVDDMLVIGVAVGDDSCQEELTKVGKIKMVTN